MKYPVNEGIKKATKKEATACCHKPLFKCDLFQINFFYRQITLAMQGTG